MGPMIAMFYANFLFLDCNQPEKARALYKRVLKHWHNLRFLWEAALHFEEHCLEEGRVGKLDCTISWPFTLPSLHIHIVLPSRDMVTGIAFDGRYGNG